MADPPTSGAGQHASISAGAGHEQISPREILWCYQLRQENVALARRIESLEKEAQCLKSQQASSVAVKEMSRELETWQSRTAALEKRLDKHDTSLVSISSLLEKKPGHDVIGERMRQVIKLIQTVQAEISARILETEEKLQTRVNDAESVLELLVKCAEASRGLTSEFGENLQRVRSTTCEMRRDLDILERKLAGVISTKKITVADRGHEHAVGMTHSAEAPKRRSKRIIKKTTIMDSQDGNTPEAMRRDFSPDSILPSIEKNQSGASQDESSDAADQSNSPLPTPEIEEHHQFGGSLEIDNMPPPPELQETQSYTSTPAPGQQRACTTLSAITPTPLPRAELRRENSPEARIQQSELSLGQYVEHCHKVLQERYPRRRDEAKAVELFWEGLNSESGGSMAKAKIEQILDERGWLWQVFVDAIEAIVRGEDGELVVRIEDSLKADGEESMSQNEGSRIKVGGSGDDYRTKCKSGYLPSAALTTPRKECEVATSANVRCTRSHGKIPSVIIAQTPDQHQDTQQDISGTTRVLPKPGVEGPTNVEGAPSRDQLGKPVKQPEVKQKNRKRRRREIPIIWNDEEIDPYIASLTKM